MQKSIRGINKTKVVQFLLSKDFATFSFFLLIAFSLWVMHSTSMRREIKTKVPIKYVGIPDKVDLHSDLPDFITISLKDEGVELWQYISKDLDSLTVDLSDRFDGTGEVELSTDMLLPRIKALMAATTQITELNPKILTARYDYLDSKEVPFLLSDKLTLDTYYVLRSATILPSTAKIYGNKTQLDSVDMVLLEVGEEGISTSGEYMFPVILPFEGCKVRPENPIVRLSVEMSSEKRVTIPIDCINVPDDENVITFPSTVDVVFSVGVSKFNTIDERDFSIELDYNILKANTSGIVEIELRQRPEDIYNVKLKQSEVEFIINKED